MPAKSNLPPQAPSEEIRRDPELDVLLDSPLVVLEQTKFLLIKTYRLRPKPGVAWQDLMEEVTNNWEANGFGVTFERDGPELRFVVQKNLVVDPSTLATLGTYEPPPRGGTL